MKRETVNSSLSVIIPVFNCELFIEKTIHSVLIQPEVNEIVVVNDGSTDNSLAIIQQLQHTDSRIKIYHHENNCNKGRSASRNLGIHKASGNYIAFLDADDFYLKNRFQNDLILFQNYKNIDGVYNAVGVHFYREATKDEQNELALTTVTEKIKPIELFENLLSNKKGYFHIDGLTVKKTIFNTIGYFVESLTVAEDTELFLKMTLKCQLATGIIDMPMAIRGIHDANVFNQEELYRKYRPKMYESLVYWSIKEKISLKRIDKLLELLSYFRYKEKNRMGDELLFWTRLISKSPSLLLSYLGYKYFPIIRKRKELFPILFR